ncbi:hypothetical protein BQ8420_00695 [Nocardiopsis sp. JB363]|nr:hypothetical protein BQ8420_00695 [Nocardiopsis sp. JB363]
MRHCAGWERPGRARVSPSRAHCTPRENHPKGLEYDNSPQKPL